jgi:hypothetical protein
VLIEPRGDLCLLLLRTADLLIAAEDEVDHAQRTVAVDARA